GGLQIKDRDGHWHIIGTVRANGRSIRVRQSSRLPARPETWDAAERLRLDAEREAWDSIIEGRNPSVPVAIAADHYLSAPRARPLGATTNMHVKKIAVAFGARL